MQLKINYGAKISLAKSTRMQKNEKELISLSRPFSKYTTMRLYIEAGKYKLRIYKNANTS